MSVFTRDMSVFTRDMSVLTRDTSVFTRDISVFTRYMSVFTRGISVFTRDMSVFTRDTWYMSSVPFTNVSCLSIHIVCPNNLRRKRNCHYILRVHHISSYNVRFTYGCPSYLLINNVCFNHLRMKDVCPHTWSMKYVYPHMFTGVVCMSYVRM